MSENSGNDVTGKDGALEEVANDMLWHEERPEIWEQGRPDGTLHCPLLEKYSGSTNPYSAE